MTQSDRQVSNDNINLVPVTSFEGPVLEFDFPALHIGAAEYKEGPTGCTVFYFPNSATSVIDVRGGNPGTIMGSTAEDGEVSAIVFAGGSLYGLEAATGVSAQLFAQNDYYGIFSVRGAIIYDYGPRRNAIYPDKNLGRAALKASQAGVFPLGAKGAGRSATVGKFLLEPYKPETAGQGSAFYQWKDTKIAVFTVVNAEGAITDRKGNVVRGHFNTQTGKRSRVDEVLDIQPQLQEKITSSAENTTLTLIVTNQKTDIHALRQLAKSVHSSMSRAIYPFHAISDGDILFAATTNEVTEQHLNSYLLSYVASELAWEAVLRCFENDAQENP